MAFFHKHRRKRGEIGLDMTPIIDCVFNLLIFFALSFNFGVTPGIKVKLPEASAEALKKEKKEMTVSISKEGTYFLDGKAVTLNDLKIEFKGLYAVNKEAMVIVQGDEAAMHGKVVQVMDTAKAAGITKLAVATKPKGSE